MFIPEANVDPEELAKSGKMPTTADGDPQMAASGPAPAAPAAPAGKK